jgi:hypothetical protein
MRDLRFTSAKKDWVAGKLGPSDVESFWPADDPANAQSVEMIEKGMAIADYVDPAPLNKSTTKKCLLRLTGRC